MFALVSAAFLNIYITQPVLPVLQAEFGSNMVRVSLTVSAATARLAYQHGGWSAMLLMAGTLLAIPILAGLGERKGDTR